MPRAKPEGILNRHRRIFFLHSKNYAILFEEEERQGVDFDFYPLPAAKKREFMEHRNWNKNNIRTFPATTTLPFWVTDLYAILPAAKLDGTIDEERAGALLNTAACRRCHQGRHAGYCLSRTTTASVRMSRLWAACAKWDRSSILSCHQNAAVELQKPGRCQAHF